MCDTLNNYDGVCLTDDGEYIITSRLSVLSIFGWTPGSLDRGDIIVFTPPNSESGEYLIKRIIGLPGETLKIELGKVYVLLDGEFVELPELYLNSTNQGHTEAFHSESVIYTVPLDSYFVLGDNRAVSNDSRRCFSALGCTDTNTPFVPIDLIEGEAKIVLFPFSHFKWLHEVDYGF